MKRQQKKKKKYYTSYGANKGDAKAIYNSFSSRAFQQNIACCGLDEFIKWYQETELKCAYCDIPENLLKPLDWGNGCLRLTIDRKNPKKGYVLSNIYLACFFCNNLKDREFTAKEMEEIGEKYIKPRWQKRKRNIFRQIKNKFKSQ